jgi:hypothetical protein
MSIVSQGVEGTARRKREGDKTIRWFPLEDDGDIILRNFGNRSFDDTASYRESLQS